MSGSPHHHSLAAMIDRFVQASFGRHVAWRAGNRSGMSQVHLVADNAGQAGVEDFTRARGRSSQTFDCLISRWIKPRWCASCSACFDPGSRV